MPNDTILTRLKNETRAQHQQTETLLFANKLLKGTLLHREYGLLLTIHYRFHQALEAAIAAQTNFFADYDQHDRRKTPWLVADLEQAGLALPEPATHLFAGWTGHQLLGAMYVAEGSTLGGRVIANALRQTPALSGLTSCFFGGYGDQTGPRWKVFGDYLMRQSNHQDELIIDAANQAFGYFQQLAEQHTAHTPRSAV
jgi:heme oxygenase (biliverdin-IX-beta and delta-forming)